MLIFFVGFYLYTEATDLKQGNVAILSKNIDLSGNTCLKLFYHMHGKDMGALRIIVGGRTVFEKTGPQGNSWNEAKVRLPGNGPTKVIKNKTNKNKTGGNHS